VVETIRMTPEQFPFDTSVQRDPGAEIGISTLHAFMYTPNSVHNLASQSGCGRM